MSRTLVAEQVSFTFSLAPAPKDAENYWDILFLFQNRAYDGIKTVMASLSPVLSKKIDNDDETCLPYTLGDEDLGDEVTSNGFIELSVTVHSEVAVPQEHVLVLRDAIQKVYEAEAAVLGFPIKFEFAERFREWQVTERIFVDGV